MARFDEGNSTIRWIPRFAREWFGLTGDAPASRRDEGRYEARTAASNSLLPQALRRFLGLTFDEPATPSARPSERRTSAPAAGPSPRNESSADSGRTRYTPSPTTQFSGTSGYTPSSVSSERRTPAGGTGDLQPIDSLLRAYARGALPPQGLEAFTREVRGTGQDVVNFYTKWINFQAEGLIKIGGNVLSTVVDALPGERSQAGTSMRRIKVTAVEDNGNGNGHDGDEAAR